MVRPIRTLFVRRRPARFPAPGRVMALVALALIGLASGGCSNVQRTMVIDSDPEGALVYMNDQEIGRTPLRRDFTWYGWYDVAVRKEGYQTLKTTAPVIAPAWQWFPVDFFAEFSPLLLKDEHKLFFTLKPVSPEQVDPQTLVGQGEELRGRLEFGERPATIRSTTKPATRPARRRHGTQNPK